MSDTENTSAAQSLTDAAGSALSDGALQEAIKVTHDLQASCRVDETHRELGEHLKELLRVQRERAAASSIRETMAASVLSGYQSNASHVSFMPEQNAQMVAKWAVQVADKTIQILSQNTEN